MATRNQQVLIKEIRQLLLAAHETPTRAGNGGWQKNSHTWTEAGFRLAASKEHQDAVILRFVGDSSVPFHLRGEEARFLMGLQQKKTIEGYVKHLPEDKYSSEIIRVRGEQTYALIRRAAVVAALEGKGE